MTRTVRCEQAVYGSFAFWSRGYALLSSSAGCRADWLDALKAAGQKFGERPPGVLDQPCTFALRISKGPWMIVDVAPQGDDDQGRPGALAFHAVFVNPWSYWLGGGWPFEFAKALRRDWSPDDQDRPLPARLIVLSSRNRPRPPAEDPRVAAIVAAMRQGRRVIVVSPTPIDDLAQAAWQRLPAWLRCKASVATWAYGTANHFDLTALPRLLEGASSPDNLVIAATGEPLGGAARLAAGC